MVVVSLKHDDKDKGSQTRRHFQKVGSKTSYWIVTSMCLCVCKKSFSILKDPILIHFSYCFKLRNKNSFAREWQSVKRWNLSVRRLIGWPWININVGSIDISRQFSCTIYYWDITGQATSDCNKRLILLSVIQLSGGQCTIFIGHERRDVAGENDAYSSLLTSPC